MAAGPPAACASRNGRMPNSKAKEAARWIIAQMPMAAGRSRISLNAPAMIELIEVTFGPFPSTPLSPATSIVKWLAPPDLAQGFDDLLDHLLCVGEQHHRVIAVEELVVDAGIADA